MTVIAVDGVARRTSRRLSPVSQFDLLTSSFDNAGNSVHAEAPFSFWRSSGALLMDMRDWRADVVGSLVDSVLYANRNADVYVLSAANFIQAENHSPERRAAYRRLAAALDQLTIPLVVLGLGVHAPRRYEFARASIPIEAVTLLQTMADKGPLVSTRGPVTADFCSAVSGRSNFLPTGCPSFFQAPDAFARIAQRTPDQSGHVLFNYTNWRKPAEQSLMRMAARSDAFWVEVLNRPVLDGTELEPGTTLLEGVPHLAEAAGTQSGKAFADRHVRFFGGYHDWVDFCSTVGRFSFGTRLHANMAALLAGIPALWITHDVRTTEAVEFLGLPSLPLGDAQHATLDDLTSVCNYATTLGRLDELFAQFNRFLDGVGLPRVRTPQPTFLG